MVFETNIICFGHMKHMRPNFREDVVNAFHRLRTPSTAAGGPPPSKREVWGASPVKAYGLAVDCI